MLQKVRKLTTAWFLWEEEEQEKREKRGKRKNHGIVSDANEMGRSSLPVNC